MKELKYVGKETVRLLGPQIVTGKAKYTGDFKLPGMQYGKILRSPHPYAKILSIDVEKAKAYPGVSAVVTWKDVDRNIYITNGFTPPKASSYYGRVCALYWRCGCSDCGRDGRYCSGGNEAD